MLPRVSARHVARACHTNDRWVHQLLCMLAVDRVVHAWRSIPSGRYGSHASGTKFAVSDTLPQSLHDACQRTGGMDPPKRQDSNKVNVPDMISILS